MSEIEEATCSDCGRTVTPDDDGYARCFGTPENPHSRNEVIRPCGICKKPITIAEICQECADESEMDAFSRPWGR